MPAAEPIRSNSDLKRMANYFLVRKRFRDYCLLVLGVCSALRISDLLSLRWEDVWDENRDRAKKHVYIVEQKTGKSKTFALNPKAEEALRTWGLHMKSEGGGTRGSTSSREDSAPGSRSRGNAHGRSSKKPRGILASME